MHPVQSPRSRLWAASVKAGVLATAFAAIMIGCVFNAPPDDSNTNGNDNAPPAQGNSGLTGKYIGSEECMLCHKNTHDHWADTLHAHALETLEAIGQDTNAACVGCHVVGWGEPGGFVDRATTNALAGVGCEACHGPGRDHRENVNDESLRPVIDISAELCGQCHTDSHHPNYDQWTESKHAQVNEDVAESFAEGTSLNNCGTCHSGDFRYLAIIRGETVPDNLLEGKTADQMTPITCAICHDPHMRTGNAPFADEGRDYQLRYPEAASPTPSNTVEDATNPERFNICGQCHHSRGRTWQTTSRAPHGSVQGNVYVGEMPVPEDTDPLVFSRVSVHSFANEQCAFCHMYRKDFEDEEAPAISGHNFTVNNEGCATAGCHPSSSAAIAAQATLQEEIQSRLDDILARLGDPADWEYSASGGPDADGQAGISDEIKKVRFLYYYSLNDGSLGVHNPDYVRDMLDEADALLTSLGK